MSGLCGVVQLDGPVDAQAVTAMVATVPHRSFVGVVAVPQAAVARSGGGVDSRFPTKAGDLLVAVDARFDNTAEVVAELGLSDRVVSNEELVAAAYLKWGVHCPARLLGDFAFVVWDPGPQRLLAVRDAMGMRPLFYRRESHRVLFASEVKQILADPAVPVRLNEAKVGLHLAGEVGPVDWTFYEGVLQLPPGHTLVADRSNLRTAPFWAPDPAMRIRDASEDDMAEHLGELFTEAVRCRMAGTKPVGVLLSGGTDSGSVASVAGSLLKDGFDGHPGICSYSWAFESMPELDEREVSAIITDHYRIPVVDVPADEAWPLGNVDRNVPDRDDPYQGHFQSLIEWSRDLATHDGVGTILSGARGDLIAGPTGYEYLDQLMAGHPGVAWDELRTEARLRQQPTHALLRQRIRELVASDLWPAYRAPRLRASFKSLLGRPDFSPVPPWVASDFAARINLTGLLLESSPEVRVPGAARRARYRHLSEPEQQRVGVWLERLYQRRGINYADPWSDRRLFELSLALPQRALNSAAAPKRLIKQAMRGVMPDEALRRTAKVSPASYFFRGIRSESRGAVCDLVTRPVSAALGYIDEARLAEDHRQFENGQPGSHDLWHALTLEIWLRAFWV